MKNYRDRIYSNYVSASEESAIPISIDSLKVRAPSMRFIISKFFPSDRKANILDLGCGYGALEYFANKRGYKNIKGIDFSEQQVALSKKLGISGVDYGELFDSIRSKNDSSLDLVISLDVIEHLTKEELIKLADNVYRVLKPGGGWLIHVPNASSPFFGEIRYGDFTHEQAFTTQSIRQLLISCGFKNFLFEESGPRIHSFKSFIRVIFWKFFRLILNVFNAAETGHYNKRAILNRNMYAISYK
jgi:2-polyprenyl-3-methyl-5-hydroxy-6-metoxy-1,4-benzoquinol methylase